MYTGTKVGVIRFSRFLTYRALSLPVNLTFDLDPKSTPEEVPQDNRTCQIWWA